MNLDGMMQLGGMVLCGIAIGVHFGVLDGIAAGLALYILAPYRPKS